MNLRTLFFTAIIMLALFGCKRDPCKKLNCFNGGVCEEGICNCQSPYDGVDCTDFSRDKYLNTFTATETCTHDDCGTTSTSGFTYEVTITKGNGDVSEILIKNFAAYGENIQVLGTVDGGKIVIPSQEISGVTFTGDGNWNYGLGTFTLHYFILIGCDYSNCHATFTL